MAWVRTMAVVGAAALVAGSAGAAAPAKPAAKPQVAAVRQVVTGPVATYWMSAQTTSGFGAGMMGGGGPGGPGGGGRGGRPSMGAMMGMMMGGGGGGAQHGLILQLGSSRKAPGEPQAEHLPPQNLGAGSSLPLLTPRAQPSQRTEETPSMPREYQKPKGKMLIFWGCGDHARPNQPVVIDFAQMADGKMPAGLEALSRGLGVTPMQPPSPTRNATYGEWPNEKTRTTVPGQGSLIGAHTVRGGYTPDINFTLSQNQDFLAPLQLTTNAVGPMGSGQLGWNPVAGAGGYLATAIGGGGDKETVVLWTSSEIQASAFALPDYLSNSDLARLVANKALMTPQTTSCAVPREMVQAAPQALVQLAAYGQETNLSYPARPADPRVPWNIEWTVKVRYKSQTGGLLGMAMPGGMAGDDDQGPRGQRGQQQPKPRGRPGLGDVLRGLGGIPQL